MCTITLNIENPISILIKSIVERRCLSRTSDNSKYFLWSHRLRVNKFQLYEELISQWFKHYKLNFFLHRQTYEPKMIPMWCFALLLPQLDALESFISGHKTWNAYLSMWCPSCMKIASFTNEVWPRNSFNVLPDFNPWILQESYQAKS